MDENDFRNLSRAFNDEFGFRMQSIASNSGILAEVRSEFVPHLTNSQIDGDGIPMSGAAVEASITFKRETIEEGHTKDFLVELERATEELGNSMRRKFYVDVDKSCADAGMTFDARGKGLSPELVYTMLEKIEIDFDASGNPIMPMLVLSPANAKKMEEIVERPEVKLRINAILMRKCFERYSL